MISLPSVSDPERRLSLSYAPAGIRDALTTLWALDERFGTVIASTQEAGIGAIRLAWWREALARLDHAPTPAEPLLQAVAAQLLPRGVSGAALSALEDGWLPLLGALDAEGLADHARERGGRLFGLAARMLAAEPPAEVMLAGEGWALVDLAFRVRDRPTAERAIGLAVARWAAIPAYRWPRRLRALGVLAELARADTIAGLDRPRAQGSPGRLARALWHGLTGR